jgi:NAD(P)-dependent dehydrogenase (short-subunit alcohol dehydrogenase family)
MRLDGKVALITGGGSGIGRASAVLFAREGAKIVVADRDEASASGTVEQIRDSYGEALAVSGDVTSNSDAAAMVKAAVDQYGKLDVLVNSAGVSSRNALGGADADAEALWDKVVEINLKGTFLVSFHAVPKMKRAGGGSIINLASIIGLVGYPADIPGVGGGFNPYAASKGGVVQLTRNLAIDSAKLNIRVNCICPGYTRSNLTRELFSDPEVVSALEERTPMGRLGQPEEIAYAALYLASDEASFVTGIPLAVDGGWTAQ